MPLIPLWVERFYEMVIPIANVGVYGGGLVWFLLFASTLGFGARPKIRLVQRWAGALALWALSIGASLGAGPAFWVVLLLGIVPLGFAIRDTFRLWRSTRTSTVRQAAA